MDAENDKNVHISKYFFFLMPVLKLKFERLNVCSKTTGNYEKGSNRNTWPHWLQNYHKNFTIEDKY